MKKKKALDILGLTINFTEDELKKQYKELAKLYHPDNGKFGNEQKFIDVQEAYKFLSEPNNCKENGNKEETVNGDSVCPICNGNGWKREKVKISRGFVATKVKCSFCDGLGKK